MRVLYLTAGYLPQFVSGLCISTDIECQYLTSIGNEVAVLALLEKQSTPFYYSLRIKSLLRGAPYECRKWRDYSVYYYSDARRSFKKALRSFKPEVVIAHPSAIDSDPALFANVAHDAGVAFHIFVRSLQPLLGEPNRFLEIAPDRVRYITNSEYMRTQLVERLSIPSASCIAVVRPTIYPDDYRVDTSESDCVLFVNPVKQKGVDIALQLAECFPQIPFLFVKGWTLSNKYLDWLNERCNALSNVTLASSSSDMRKYYRRAKLLIAPSPNSEDVFIEAWGRVASEAQISGIPVIATAGGGLSEAVGDGGILVRPEAGIDGWKDALRQLWTDKSAYAQRSAAALAHAARDEIQPDCNLRTLRSTLERGASERATNLHLCAK